MYESVPLFAFGGCSLKIDEETDVVIRFWLVLDKRTILSFEDVESTVAYKLIPATDVHRKKEGRLTIKSGEVKPNPVKVYELHIKGGRSAMRVRSLCIGFPDNATAHFENLSARVVWMI